jgi:filamentous hemagglutinin
LEQAGEQEINEHIRTFEVLQMLKLSKGNFGLGSGTREEALKWGANWVGPGYKVSNNGGAWVSQSGERVFRLPSYKKTRSALEANFELYSGAGREGKPIKKGHLKILP